MRPMDLQISGRTFIVTGGSSGLGLATAEALVAEDANVVISSRSQEKIDAAVGQLGDRAAGLALDNAAHDAGERLFAAAAEAFADAPVAGVFISVGGPAVGHYFDTSEEQWREAIESVFLGSLRLARCACERLETGSAVGMVLSSSVWNPIPSIAISNALRPGIAMAIKNMADEIGPRGIRIFGVAPGQILTPRIGEAPGAEQLSHVPLRRLGQPHEFGQVAAFLLSPIASYITGSVIAVDGGMVRSL